MIVLTDGLRARIRQPETPQLRMASPRPSRMAVVPVVGPQGPPGAPGGAVLAYRQTVPAATWIIQHDLGRKPPAVLLPDDSAGQPVWTDVTYPDDNTVTIEWPTAVSGWAYL